MDSFWILLFSFLILLIYRFLTKNYDYWEKQNIPFVKNPFPGFGSLLPLFTLRKGMYNFTNSIYKSTTSSMIGLYFMRRPALMIREPELVKCVLQTNFMNFRANLMVVTDKQDSIFSKHPLLISDMDIWKDRRLHVRNNLSSKKLQHLFVIAQNARFKLCEYLDKKIDECGGYYESELKSNFIRFTGEFVANSVLGIEGQCFHDNPDKMSYSKIAEKMFELTMLNGLNQVLIFYMPDIATFCRLKLVPDHTKRYFRENVQTIMKQRKQQNITPNDYLQFVIDSVDENDMDTIISDLILFHTDIYESSSSIISHFFYQVSLHPEIQEKLREHIFSKLNGNMVTYESLKTMTYLDQVLNESMRIIPPEVVILKVCTEEITLTGTDGLKCHLKPGFPIFVPMTNIHQDGKYWPNPEVFDPERFSPENENSTFEFAYFPFGKGPRMCVGMRLSSMIIKLAIVTVITKYSLEFSSKTKVPLEIDSNSILTLYKGGVWAKLKKLNT